MTAKQPSYFSGFVVVIYRKCFRLFLMTYGASTTLGFKHAVVIIKSNSILALKATSPLF